MEKINFPYRSESHLPFLHVVGQSGSWEKHGLQVDYDKYISSEDAHNNVANGSVEFVGGNHLSPYSRRPKGDRWVYLVSVAKRGKNPTVGFWASALRHDFINTELKVGSKGCVTFGGARTETCPKTLRQAWV